jgi:PAS domain S-box-containing protein
MKIKTKLQIVAVMPVAVFFAAMAVQFVLSVNIDSIRAQEAIVAALAREVSDLTSLTYEYGITRGERARIQWTAQYGYLEAHLNEAAALFNAPDKKKALDDIRQNVDDAGKRFSALKEFDAKKRSAERFYGLRNNLVNSLILVLQEILPLADKLHDMNKAEADRLGRYTNRVTLFLVFTLILCMPPVLYFIVRRITSPIEALHDGMRIIASGNLQHRIRVDSTDEVGVLSLGFNEMAGQIQEVTVNRDELAREIAERKRAEEALAKSEARFRRLAENARDLIYRMSLPDGAYEYMSPAATELSGYTPEEFYRNPQLLREFIHPEWRPYIEEQWSRLLKGEMPPTYEFQIIHRSGDVRWVNQRNIMVRDEEGRPVAIEGVVTDITERKRAEEDLCRLNEKLRSLNEELEQRVKQRTAELEEKNAELYKMNRLFVGRELRMVELKEKIKELEKAANKE